MSIVLGTLTALVCTAIGWFGRAFVDFVRRHRFEWSDDD